MFGEFKKLPGEKIMNHNNLIQQLFTATGGEYDCPDKQKVGNCNCPESEKVGNYNCPVVGNINCPEAILMGNCGCPRQMEL